MLRSKGSMYALLLGAIFSMGACGGGGPTTSRSPQPNVEQPPEEAIRLLSQPIDLHEVKPFRDEILARQSKLKNSTWGPTDCRWVSNENIPSTLLCLSAKKKDQNAIFTRASLFSEGSKDWKKGRVIAHTDSIYIEAAQHVLGHDIMGQVLADFFQAARSTQDKPYILTSHEKSFYDHVLTKVQAQAQGRPYAVITAISDFSFVNDIPPDNASAIHLELTKSVVSHEALHAQYFLNENVRRTVEHFWNHSMDDVQRSEIKAVLGESYDVSDTYVLLNEFLAFMLQYDPGILEEPWSQGVLDLREPLRTSVETAAQVDVFEY